MKSAAVLTFINTTSGRYQWWDEFPALITAGLGREGVDHVVFRRDYNERSADPPGSRHPTPEGSLARLGWLREHVRPVAQQYERVVFHTHGHYQPILLGREVWHHGRARWFWTEHRISDPGRLDPAKRAARALGQRAKLLPSRMYGVSQAGAARLRDQFDPGSVRCVRTGVRIRPNTRAPGPAGGGERPARALFVGRLIEEKGFWTLLRAFTLLADTDVTLTLVGPGPIDEIHRFLDAHGLRDRVSVAGYQHDTRPFYEEADFVVIPTVVREALGMVSLEARMYGLPVIYSRRGGLPETQVEETTGLALDAITPAAIADAIRRLTSDPALYQRLAQAAPLGLEAFGIDRMVEAYVTDYLETLRGL